MHLLDPNRDPSPADLAAALRAMLQIIAPDGKCPPDLDEQLRAAAARVFAEGIVDADGWLLGPKPKLRRYPAGSIPVLYK